MKTVTKLSKIGNSQGVRIPRAMLSNFDATAGVELEQIGAEIVIRPILAVKDRWEADAQRLHELGEDKLIMGDKASGSSWDNDQWVW